MEAGRLWDKNSPTEPDWDMKLDALAPRPKRAPTSSCHPALQVPLPSFPFSSDAPTSRPSTAICSSAAFETAATLLKVGFCAVRPPARHAQPSTNSVLDKMEPSRVTWGGRGYCVDKVLSLAWQVEGRSSSDMVGVRKGVRGRRPAAEPWGGGGWVPRASAHLHHSEHPLLQRKNCDDQLRCVAEGGVEQSRQGLVGVKRHLVAGVNRSCRPPEAGVNDPRDRTAPNTRSCASYLCSEARHVREKGVSALQSYRKRYCHECEQLDV